jgi:hypothetical protein
MRLIALFFALGLVSIGASAAPKMFDSHTCIRSYIQCDAPAMFMHDTDGRCGCFSTTDYMPIKECIISHIVCPTGSIFSSLKDMDGKTVGCGCYETFTRD